MKKVVLFDGNCLLCNRSVYFILKRDPAGAFNFASLNGEKGQRLLKQYGLDSQINSLVVLDNNRAYTKSDAVLQICKHMNGIWHWMTFINILPRVLRDSIYDIIAANRYKWFGKNNHCILPEPSWRQRFLD